MDTLSRYRAVLLDMNGTFMFNPDRFGPGEDFAATYLSLGGTRLSPRQIEGAIRDCHARLDRLYHDPTWHDDFPSVAEALEVAPSLPAAELRLLEGVFARHELGWVPGDHAAFLRDLAATHRLGVVSNLWSRKGPWLAELDRAGVLGLFGALAFSSDGRSVKPSPALFRRALDVMGAWPSEVLFVGDSLRCDVEGARAAGLAAVWVSPGGGRTRGTPSPLRRP